ncbi:N-acetyltransferase [Hippea jasoniae]|uniref:N-acetyltransferase n=1 Tax=Hippea jasoniae TaxID=944479 RepID=UPI0005543D73|nr:N-acetyltransferase [Hippea jasoniae]
MKELEVLKPTLDDVDDIYSLVDFYAKKGDILPRSRENISERIREFVCVKDNNRVVGIASLRIFYPKLAEIRTIAVDEQYQNRNLGKRLIEACLNEAKILKVKDVFALTFRVEFFLKLGFELIDKKLLPSKKIWEDCINCPLFPSCKEEAVIYHIY